MKTTPWFKLWVDDYQRDTRDLTAEQHGVYFQLLMISWGQSKGLPNDLDWIRCALPIDLHNRRTFRRVVPPILERFFALSDDGFWINKRLELERSSAKVLTNVRSKSARTRWKTQSNQGNGHANASNQNQIQKEEAEVLWTSASTGFSPEELKELETELQHIGDVKAMVRGINRSDWMKRIDPAERKRATKAWLLKRNDEAALKKKTGGQSKPGRVIA